MQISPYLHGVYQRVMPPSDPAAPWRTSANADARPQSRGKMATKGPRSTESGRLPDQRRSVDRRASPRTGQGGTPGRRSTDVADARSTSAAEKSDAPSRKRRATRDGREPLVVYLRPESIKSLKIAALERDTTASAIMADALDLWFRNAGRSARR